MVVLTREGRRSRVLELHNEGKGTREIAEILHISFRDIADILKDADREKESEQQQARQEFLSSQAYKLFSEGKSPVQVAIDLNMKAAQAIVFQRECWDLKVLPELNQIYEEIKDNPWPFVEMYNLSKAAVMNPQHVVKLLRIANNDLPSVEYRYQTLIAEISSLKEQKRDLNNEVTKLSSEAEYYRASCLREKRMCGRFEFRYLLTLRTLNNYVRS